MTDKAGSMATARSDCPQIYKAIDQANTAEELHRIARVDILQAKQLNEQARHELLAAVDNRFAVLDAAALKPLARPRWS